MGRVISTAIQFIDGFTRPSREVIQSMRQMGNEAIKAGKQIQNAGKTIANAGATLTKAVTLPIAGVATAAVKTAADFEAAMSEVGAISGASGEDMAKLTAKAKEMGATTAFSASESAEAMKYMAMAGWKTADMTEGIAGIMNLAAASGEDLATTSDIVTDGLTAFGMAAKESGRFADVMAATSSNANTNVALMGETFKYCASTAGAMGYSIEDISVAIGIMGNAGIKGSMAGTTLKNTMANLAKPTDAQAAVMKKLGISLTDSSGNMKSFAEVMDNLRSSFSGLSETEKAAAATTLAGKESMAGLLTIVNASTEDFDKLTAAINGSSGSAEEMAAKMLDNLNGQLTLLKSAVEGIAITIGNKLMPYVKTAVSWVQKAADYINNLNDAQLDNIIKWAGIAAAIGPAIMVFGKIVTAVGTAQRIFGTITKTIANFGGIMGVITSPAGIVIGVLAAIALAAFLIIKNWDKVKGFLQGVGNWFKNAFDKAGFSVEGFKRKFTSIGNTIGSIAGKIGGFCKAVAGIFKKEFAGDIKAGAAEAGGILETLVGGTVAAFDGIVTAVDKGLQVFDALLSFFTGAFAGNWDNAAQGFRNSLKNIFPPDIAEGLTKAFDTALPAIKAAVSGIKAMFGGLVQDVKKIFGGITTVFKGIGTMLKGIFSGDAETALKGFQTAAGGIVDTIGNIFKAKINAIKNFVVGAFSTFLPESVVKKIAGVFDAVASAWDIAIGAAKGYISGFVQAIKPLIENIKTIFKGVAQFVKGVFTGDWKGALNGLKTIASGALSGLVNIIKAPFKLIANTVKGAVNSFKNLNIVKSIFTALGNAIKNVLTKCGVDMKKFSATINNIKTRVGSIINGLKTIFSTVFNAIGKVVKALATVIANIFGKKVSSTCSAAGAVITAFKAVASAAFNFIAGAIKKAMNIIVPVVKVAFGAIKGAISAAVNTITSIISGVLTVFDGLITFISGVFTGNWRQAWEGVKSIFKGIFDTFAAICKAPINAVIGIINGAISALNKINVTIPDWVPGLGGKSFGINIPTIPQLYKGTDNWKGGMAMIHDRGGEIVDLPQGSRVYPHDKSVEMARREGERNGSGSISINIQKLADKIEVRSDEDIDRIAEALAYKLKKIAFNTGTA
ncbi:MAG: phage tail tape measure protein [Eubacterium sp.]|nr:phage tail tape measure protein [Eubacterium sp.]